MTPAPHSARQSEPGLDPVLVEVVRNKLDGIANEMELTLLKSSFSPIVKEGMDASASIFSTSGESLAQAIAVPIHLATLIPCVRRILDEYPIQMMEQGDVYVMNDPYMGGTHLPDIAVVAPIFHGGQVVALSATMTHHQDVGGMSPGSIPTNATEIFQEGIRIPVMKLFRKGQEDRDLLNLLALNVRMPESFRGDLMAQVAACNVGIRRVQDLCLAYGNNQLSAIFEELLLRSEQMTRLALRRIPEGKYHYEDSLDNDGVDHDRPIKLAVTVEVRDGEFIVDFTGTSPQTRGPFNCVRSGVEAAAAIAIRMLTDERIPTNGGCFRPIKLILPEGSLVNPREPAPVNARATPIKRLTSIIVCAFRDVLPEKVPADPASMSLVLMLSGKDGRSRTYVIGELIVAGSGASRDKDGVDVIDTDASNCMNMPVEALEMEAPLRVHRTELRRDSGGAGRTRGGLGIVREYELLEGEIQVTHRGERHAFAAKGAYGGGDGLCSESILTKSDGSKIALPSKTMFTLRAGERLRCLTAGGGGYGSPAERPLARVLDDIANRKVSPEAAISVYRIDPSALSRTSDGRATQTR